MTVVTEKQRRARAAAWRKAREKLAPSLWVRAAIDGHLQGRSTIGFDLGRPARQHVEQRQGDEIACSCGLRWSVGECHP